MDQRGIISSEDGAEMAVFIIQKFKKLTAFFE
jgi:hypothetical protein